MTINQLNFLQDSSHSTKTFAILFSDSSEIFLEKKTEQSIDSHLTSSPGGIEEQEAQILCNSILLD